MDTKRKVFYIDIGDMSKMKAEQYIKNLMRKYQIKSGE